MTPEFDNVNVLVDILKDFSKVFGQIEGNTEINNIPAKGFSIAPQAIADARLFECHGVAGNHDDHAALVTLSLTQQQTVKTNINDGGPGSADLIFYLKNAKLAWFSDGAGPLRVTVFGHDGLAATSVGFFKSGGNTDLDAATVYNYSASIPSWPADLRWCFPRGDSSCWTRWISTREIKLVETHSVNIQDSQQSIRTSTRVQNNKPSMLHYLGIGVTDENSLQTTITHSSSVQTSTTNTIANTIDLFAEADERYCVEIYCDVIFGTFAYRQVAAMDTPLLTGTAFTLAGKPAAGLTVTLTNNGRKFTTRTNSSGVYSFHASSIKRGSSQLEAKDIKMPFVFTAPGQKVDLKPQRQS